MNHRLSHYALLLAVMAFTGLPNLGAPSLWDMDEGVNAECSREMMETGTWIVPTYNYDLRTAKPVLLYWLQRASYNCFGVNEWAARFPSFLMGTLTVLLVYELGRRMLSPASGLLGGVALASCFEFVKLSHAATPDAAFIFFCTLTMALFWIGHENGSRRWFVPTAIAAAFAVLTKGPIGLGVPGLVILLYFAWNRELFRLWDRKFLWGVGAFLLVALPWYALVTAETRGAYIKAFFGHENVNRFMTPQENHRGPVVYYLGAILVFFAPWSAVIGAALWYGWRSSKRIQVELTHSQRAYRFLLLWVLAYLLFFSAAATKLPNYIAPLYPALALLIADFLVRWSNGSLAVARGLMPTAIAGLVLTGVCVIVGLLIASGRIAIPMKNPRPLPDLAPWALLGVLPLACAAAMIAFLRQDRRDRATLALSLTSVVFIGLIAAFPTLIVDAAKAPKTLVEESGAKQLDRDIRLASLDFTQQSLTFYAERRVERMPNAQTAAEFLAMPRPAYLFVPAKVWDEHVSKLTGPHRIAARKYDFYRNDEILVVTNDGVLR